MGQLYSDKDKSGNSFSIFSQVGNWIFISFSLLSIFSPGQITVKEGTVITGKDLITVVDTLTDKENTIVFISEGTIVSNLDGLIGNQNEIQIIKKVKPDKKNKPFVQKIKQNKVQLIAKPKKAENKNLEIFISSNGKKPHFFSENKLQVVAFSGQQKNKKKYFLTEIISYTKKGIGIIQSLYSPSYYKPPIIAVFSDFSYSERPPPFV